MMVTKVTKNAKGILNEMVRDTADKEQGVMDYGAIVASSLMHRH